jgi:hypothetical protein
MNRKCVICGKEFYAPPSSKKITCSKACSAVRKSQTHKGKPHKWSADKRGSARAAAAKTGNLRNGTKAALQLPEGQRGPQNRESKIWHLRDPAGNPVLAVNLLDWARLHAADYFDMEPTDRSAHTIATGFRQIKLSMEGKRFQNGKPTPVSTYKGWTLVAWEDGPSHKSHKK